MDIDKLSRSDLEEGGDRDNSDHDGSVYERQMRAEKVKAKLDISNVGQINISEKSISYSDRSGKKLISG